MDTPLALKAPAVAQRNPGPTWGFAFLLAVQRLPHWLLRFLMMAGTWVSVGIMPAERRHSRAYLSRVYGRRASAAEVWRHFHRYLEFLLLRLRVADGEPVACRLHPEHAGVFEQLVTSSEPALFGTFHFGHSDLLGFALARRGRRVAMIRLRVGNAADTDMLAQQFGDAVRFIWVNEPENLLFAMKGALDAGESLAMQCDRLYASRTESFQFLGAPRLFPFTIYHLAVLFQRPVMFCFGLPDGPAGTLVCATPLYRPDPRQSRDANLTAARAHFQNVLERLEALVRQQPALWFNFIPLNPEAAPGSAS